MADPIRIEIPIETVDETEPGLSQAQEKVSKYDKTIEKTHKSLLKMAKEKYQLLLEAKDKVTPLLQQVGTGVKALSGKAWSVTMKAIDLATKPIRGVINLLRNPIIQAGAILGVSISLGSTIDTYKTFEATMSRVEALSNASSEQMTQLTQKAKEMGAITKFSGTESAEAFTYMSQAGWGVQDMLDGISGVMSLAASDGLDLATTTDIVANALTAFGLTAKDSSKFADVMAIASSASNTDVTGLGEAFKYVAPVAGAMKYSIEDVSLALGIMSNNAVKGSMAGTSLKTALANMAAPTKKMSQAMQEYGIRLTDSKGNMKSLRGVLDDMRNGLGELSESEQTAAASTIFGKEAMAGMLGIINASEKDYKSLADQIDNSNGAADRMATTMQDNLAGALEQLGGAVETVQLTWGERLKPYILALSEALEENMPSIEAFGVRAFDALDKKVAEVKKKVADFTSTDVWQDASIFGKAEISWNELIARPFQVWWRSEGKDLFTDASGNIGNWIGTGISNGILTLLGVDTQNAMSEGASIASAFSTGFLAGFDGDAVKETVMNAVKGIFKDAFDGDSSTSILSKAALLYAGTQAMGLLGPIANISKGAAGIGSLGLGSASKGTGLLGFGAYQAIKLGAGKLAGGASLSAGSLSALGLGAVGGTAIGAAGIISAINNLRESSKYNYDKERREKETRTGVTKIGMVGAGAAAGAALGSVIPGVGTLVGAGIGAGVGGLGALFGGDSASNMIGDLYGAKDRQQQVLFDMADDLRDAMAEYKDITQQNDYASGLIGQYEELEKVLSSDGLTSDDAVQVQERMQEIAMELQNLFPDLISNYDILNGKTGERIGLLQNEMDLLNEQTSRQLRQNVQDTREQLPEIQENWNEVGEQLKAAEDDWEVKNQYRQGLSEYLQQFDAVSTNPNATDEEREAARNQLMESANTLSDNLGQGHTFLNTANIIAERESLQNETKEIMAEIDELSGKRDELEQTLSAHYDSSVQLAAMDNGMDISSLLTAIDQINSMRDAMTELNTTGDLSKESQATLNDIIPGFKEAGDAAEQTKLLAEKIRDIVTQSGDAIVEINNLNKALDELPYEKKISIVTTMPTGSFSSFYGPIPKKANGGVVDSAHLFVAGEDGPETVIPLGSKRRSRGIDLWMQAGEMLGIGRYADGALLGAELKQNGIYTNYTDDQFESEPRANNEFTGAIPVAGIDKNSNTVTVKVDMAPSFRIDGGNPDQIMETIKASMKELTDDICGDIAAKLSVVFSNIPKEA